MTRESFTPTEKAATAAIARGLAAGQVDKYFGSTLALNDWLMTARKAGLVESEAEQLTRFGKAVAVACEGIPEGRWYFRQDAYVQAFDTAQAERDASGP